MSENRFYHGDCLFCLNHDIPAESVDLIYLDPPFFTGKVQKAKGKWQPGAMEISFKDTKSYWSQHLERMRQQAPIWLNDIGNRQPALAAYLYYMMERLQACHRVLKKTGSIYLHCDYRASHYLKLVMDDVFGANNFRNEIIWCYSRPSAPRQRQLSRCHESILWYSRDKKWTFNPNSIRLPYAQKSLERAGYGAKASKIAGGPGQEAIVELKESGKFPEDWWQIPLVKGNAKEYMGYPTQKPEALLRRIILASSNEGDLVLDPFCGCGTTAIVASKLNRRFIGIDIDSTAFQVIKNRAHELFSQTKYISRDLDEVKAMGGNEFQDWVNEYFQATRPHPDLGVDGITPAGVPIQSKSYTIKYTVLSQFVTDAKYHPKVPKPIKEIIAVSKTGFDEGAFRRKFEIESAEGIKVKLLTPEEMLR